jgi:hypothetical protein
VLRFIAMVWDRTAPPLRAGACGSAGARTRARREDRPPAALRTQRRRQPISCFSRFDSRLGRSQSVEGANKLEILLSRFLDARSGSSCASVSRRPDRAKNRPVSDVAGHMLEMPSGTVGRLFTYHGPVRRPDGP